jgi:hypothetical protein
MWFLICVQPARLEFAQVGASFAARPYKLSWLDIRHGRHSMRSTALRNPVLSGIVGPKIRGKAQ